MSVTLQEAIKLIIEKRQAEVERHLRKFEEEPELEVLNGRYGPYIAYKGNNYRLPKTLAERAKELTLEECMTVVKEQDEKPKTTARKRTYSKKKMTRIILIGYMGAGKTTVGKALSQSLSLPFYDLDWYIEERYRRTIPPNIRGKRRKRIPRDRTESPARGSRVRECHYFLRWGYALLFRQHGIHEPAGTNGVPESFSRRAVPASEDGKGGTSSAERQNGGRDETIYPGFPRDTRTLLQPGTIYIRCQLIRELR